MNRSPGTGKTKKLSKSEQTDVVEKDFILLLSWHRGAGNNCAYLSCPSVYCSEVEWIAPLELDLTDLCAIISLDLQGIIRSQFVEDFLDWPLVPKACYSMGKNYAQVFQVSLSSQV